MTSVVPLLQHRRVRAGILRTLAVILFVGESNCASQKPGVFTSQLDPTKIVKRNASDAFETQLTVQDLPALTRFKDQILTARTRADLTQAWNGISDLHAKGSDFLERRVFKKALEDGDWPPNTLAGQAEGAFVAGVQQATSDFLARGSN